MLPLMNPLELIYNLIEAREKGVPMGAITASVPAQTELDFKAAAREKGVTVSSIVRDLIDKWLEENRASVNENAQDSR